MDATYYCRTIRSIPDERTIRETLAFRPDAKPLLDAWHRSFWLAFKESKFLEYKSEIASREEFIESLPGKIQGYLETNQLGHAACQQAVLDNAGVVVRDARLHVIDDALAYMSILQAIPYRSFIKIDDAWYRFDGVNEENGVPTPSFTRGPSPYIERMERRRKALEKYWMLDAYLKDSKRLHFIAPDATSAAAILLSMAQRGHAKAFLKGQESKTGTWTMDLRGVHDLSSAMGRYASTIFPTTHCWDPLKAAMLIQEHLPFTHEQRFFVQGGRLIGSVCSDRNMCGLDMREGKRLDDRVAVLLKPANAPGDYDRGTTTHVVDRRMAASFARLARKTVQAIGRDRLDYVIDVGMTARGPAIVEFNELLRAGPYCLDHSLLAKAPWKEKQRLDAKMRESLNRVVAAKELVGLDDVIEELIESVARHPLKVSTFPMMAVERLFHDIANEPEKTLEEYVRENRGTSLSAYSKQWSAIDYSRSSMMPDPKDEADRLLCNGNHQIIRIPIRYFPNSIRSDAHLLVSYDPTTKRVIIHRSKVRDPETGTLHRLASRARAKARGHKNISEEIGIDPMVPGAFVGDSPTCIFTSATGETVHLWPLTSADGVLGVKVNNAHGETITSFEVDAPPGMGAMRWDVLTPNDKDPFQILQGVDDIDDDYLFDELPPILTTPKSESCEPEEAFAIDLLNAAMDDPERCLRILQDPLLGPQRVEEAFEALRKHQKIDWSAPRSTMMLEKLDSVIGEVKELHDAPDEAFHPKRNTAQPIPINQMGQFWMKALIRDLERIRNLLVEQKAGQL